MRLALSRTKARASLLAELEEAMRRSSAQGVLYGQTVANVAGIANSDLECMDILYLEGRVTAVAFADRVEARDPADESARLLQVMASLQTGRLADPSCVAPERINPPVEEGQREIRMEYRVPTAAPEAGPRLRVPLRRTG